MSRRWKDLTPGQRRWIVLLGTVQLTLAAFAWTDLALRPAEVVNGPKRRWAWLIAVNFVGPLAYLRWGRRLYSDEKR
ncbi:PLDc N-terminal domain-containing protein [Kutzneria buriramensis]|uniref:Phospholipase D-like protein n=1 Tax=Kutzneria buriramensis TaxID=1045776 RepID=A0A3E0GYI0_9PSEU|nr:PLDc N-terminal domain-containing protein [Kutzneria buriramensis]REH34831.1 phospholipase D-like protein [Kutzneria buriramensis]